MRVFAISLVLGVLVLTGSSTAVAQSPENEAMARQVAQVLKESGRLKSYRVGVKYQDGVAWLDGTVASEEQRQTAEALAYQADGVARVVNRLEVAASPPRNDTEIAGGDLTMPVAPSIGNDPLAVQMASTSIDPLTAGHLGPQPAPFAQGATESRIQPAAYPVQGSMGITGGPVPIAYSTQGMVRQVSHDHATMPGYAWPSYAAYPNYAALTYPQQYSAAAWPYIGPFYPYPQVPLGWRKVTLEWDDGWWFLDFCE
jgi:hypothetical protein